MYWESLVIKSQKRCHSSLLSWLSKYITYRDNYLISALELENSFFVIKEQNVVCMCRLTFLIMKLNGRSGKMNTA